MSALKNCTYDIVSADSLYLANTPVTRLIDANGFVLERSQHLALAFMRQDIPLRGILRFKITNNGPETAGINEFDYKVFIKDKELAKGSTDRKISIEPGQSSVIPVRISENIFPLVSEPANIKALSDFVSSDSLKTAIITLKIKPSVSVGNKKINYPGYIDIDKPVTNRELLTTLNGLK